MYWSMSCRYGWGGESLGGVGFVGDGDVGVGEGDVLVVAEVGVGFGFALRVGLGFGVGVADGEGVDDGVLDRPCRSAPACRHRCRDQAVRMLSVGRRASAAEVGASRRVDEGGCAVSSSSLASFWSASSGGEGVVGDLPADAERAFDGDAQEAEVFVVEDLASGRSVSKSP